MKRKKLPWLTRLAAFFHRQEEHHRICWRCHKAIRRREHWHQVKVGWFAPFYTVEHKDCDDPFKLNPVQVIEILGPNLPFEGEIVFADSQKTNDLKLEIKEPRHDL